MSNGSTEADIYAEFGVEPLNNRPEAADPAGEGGKEQGVAGPDGAKQATGNREQGTGDGGTDSSTPLRSARNDRAGDGMSAKDGTPPHPSPAATPSPQGEGFGTKDGGRPVTAPTGGTGETDSSDGSDGQKEPEPMSREERTRQARLRREREEKARIDAAVQKALQERDAKYAQELSEIFSTAGMTDRYNGGKAITSKEEFDAWKARAQAEKLGRELKNGSLTPESFQQAVEASPAVQKAAALAAKLEAQEQEQKAQADKAAFDRQVEAELAEIAKLDPGVHSVEDALALETGEEFRRLVTDRGLSFLEAFRLANMDRIADARAQAAARGAALRQGGKEHLRSVVASGGSVPMDVPRDVIEMYRDMCPEMTVEQIRQDYQKRYKG